VFFKDKAGNQNNQDQDLWLWYPIIILHLFSVLL
jgi:hypothetical protein